MEFAALMIAGLALIAAAASLILLAREKRENQQWKKATLDYVLAEKETVIRYAEDELAGLRELISKQGKSHMEAVEKVRENLRDELAGMEERFDKALKELALDYQDAQKAASHVNDFAMGLANIFDYDPIKSRQRHRQSGEGD